MLRLNKKTTKPFLIKHSSKDVDNYQHSALFDILYTASASSTLTVEGITGKTRKSKEKKVPLGMMRNEDTYTEFGIFVKKERNVIGVGVSSKFDVSFESLKDFKLADRGCYSIYSVPVYDLTKDFGKIIEALRAYLLDTLESSTTTNNCGDIAYHSNFIRVGNSRIDYDDLEAITGNNTQTASTPTAYDLKSISFIQ